MIIKFCTILDESRMDISHKNLLIMSKEKHSLQRLEAKGDGSNGVRTLNRKNFSIEFFKVKTFGPPQKKNSVSTSGSMFFTIE